MPDETLVFPGDEIAIAEEFVPGPGAYEENGKVYAAWLGRLHLDTRNFLARVEPATKVPIVLRPGDRVIALIDDLRSSMAIVEVRARIDNPARQVAGERDGTLHISKMSDEYIDRIDNAYHLGDIIRAEVTGVDPSLQLTTVHPDLGILVSLCPRCRTTMQRRGRGLVCPECEWKDVGKLARDYGEGNV
ncbi:MAG: exosome complex RNA-binding protein Csl4 [Methanobacteriota archaeon]